MADAVGVDLAECAVTYSLLPSQVVEAFGSASGEGDLAAEGGDVPTSDGEESDGEAGLDDRLKAAESFLIRLTMPIFNLKQD